MDLRTAVALSMLPAAQRIRALSATQAPRLAPEIVRLADHALVAAKGAALQPLAWGEAGYPPRLAAIFDPPAVLWVKGTVGALPRDAVAIVGARNATPYAMDVARHLGLELARRGVVVVSGLARGVDSAAHRGALDAGGTTVAVLGSGADVIYPAEHKELARDIAGDGALVSEFAPGTRPRPHHFPLRNRVISGLSLAVVVIEASEKSGSLITAAAALEQGREVMAVPGNVLSGRNRGAHALLRDGAKIVESVDDILEELSLPGRGPCRADGPAPLLADSLLGVMAAGESYDLDALAAVTGLDPVKLLPRLLDLELSGALRREPGGRFTRSLAKADR